MTIPRSWRSGHAGRSRRPGALPQGRGRRSQSGSSHLPIGEHQEFRVDLANDPVAAVVLGGVEARVDSLDSMTGRARPMGSLPPRPRLSCGRDSRRSSVSSIPCSLPSGGYVGNRQPLAQTRDRQDHGRLLAAGSSTIRRDGLFGDGDGVQSAS